jgi:hypothetical protein
VAIPLDDQREGSAENRGHLHGPDPVHRALADQLLHLFRW